LYYGIMLSSHEHCEEIHVSNAVCHSKAPQAVVAFGLLRKWWAGALSSACVLCGCRAETGAPAALSREVMITERPDAASCLATSKPRPRLAVA
jgi:hypothetical protein